jgi:hypothetical protein
MATGGLLTSLSSMISYCQNCTARYSTNSGKRVPTSSGNKRGDLEIKRLNVAGTSDIIINVNVVHEFHGSVAQDERHGQLLHPNPDKVLIVKTVTKVQGNAYHQDYLHNHNKAFLPLIMSTSGRLHCEFVRLLCILAHWRAVRFFEALGYEPCYEELSVSSSWIIFLSASRAHRLCWRSGRCPPHGWQHSLLSLLRALVSNPSSPSVSKLTPQWILPQWISISLTKKICLLIPLPSSLAPN